MHAVFAINDSGVHVRIGMFCALSPPCKIYGARALSVKYMVCVCACARSLCKIYGVCVCAGALSLNMVRVCVCSLALASVNIVCVCALSLCKIYGVCVCVLSLFPLFPL